MSATSDNELIERFLSGERAAFDELVIRHQRRVYATARRMLGSDEAAEEIAQETFLRAFRSLRKFRRRSRFTTWLYRIAMNLCYNELKRRGERALPGPVPDPVDSPHGKIEREERRRLLERHIARLPLKQKSALTLRIFEEMPFKDIGRAVGCSANSAKVNYRHALMKLRRALESEGEEI